MIIDEYKTNQQKLEIAVNAPNLAQAIKTEINSIDSKIGAGGTDKSQSLLELVSNYCQNNNLVLREFPEVLNSYKNDFNLSTQMFVIEGDFASLLQLVYTLEQKVKLGKVSSVDYTLRKNNTTKKMALTATVYLQNLKKTTNEH